MKKILLFNILLAVALSVNAQSMKDLFLKMPQSVCPLLTEYNRLEIVDNQKNGKSMMTRNQVLSVSEMKELKDDYARLALSKSSEKVFKILKKTDGTPVVIVISTVFIDKTPDSSVEFFDTEWKPLDSAEMLANAVSKDFRYITIDKETDELRIMTGHPLTLQMNGSDELPKEKASTVVMKWNGSKFE